MHIGYIVESISRAGGGVSEIARRTAQFVSEQQGTEVSVLSLHDHGSAEDIPAWKPVEPKLHPAAWPRSLNYARGLKASLNEANADLWHAHGIWGGVVATGARWSKVHNKPFVLTIHGMLEPWAIRNSRWKKQLAGLLYANRSHRSAQCLHVNTEAELRNVRNHGLTNPICLIPNGVDLPGDEELSIPTWEKEAPHPVKNLLFLGRLHPKKGLLEMLEGWQLWKKKVRRPGVEARDCGLG